MRKLDDGVHCIALDFWTVTCEGNGCGRVRKIYDNLFLWEGNTGLGRTETAIAAFKALGFKVRQNEYGDYELVRVITKKALSHRSPVKRIPKKHLPAPRLGRKKLTEAEVVEIRRLSKTGMCYGDISKKIGKVNVSTIGKVVRGEYWKHIAKEHAQAS
jgi:hypothetical protein